MASAIVLACRTLTADPGQDNVERLWTDYQQIHSLHLKATESLEIPQSNVSGGHGTYEYWVDGPKFKIADIWDPRERPGVENEVYWDGKQFLCRVVGGSSVMVSSHIHLKLPVADPLPLVPFRFVFPGGADDGAKLTLDQLQEPQTRQLFGKLRSLNASGSEARYPAPAFDYTHVPDVARMIDSTYHIQFGGQTGYLPVKILREISTGEPWETWEIKYALAHSMLGDIYLPSEVKHTSIAAFETDPVRRVGIFSFKVTQLDLNSPITPDTFSADFKSARDVFDMDRSGHAPTTVPATPTR
jgi:hypothetical protein